jgi:hypothetical protein
LSHDILRWSLSDWLPSCLHRRARSRTGRVLIRRGARAGVRQRVLILESAPKVGIAHHPRLRARSRVLCVIARRRLREQLLLGLGKRDPLILGQHQDREIPVTQRIPFDPNAPALFLSRRLFLFFVFFFGHLGFGRLISSRCIGTTGFRFSDFRLPTSASSSSNSSVSGSNCASMEASSLRSGSASLGGSPLSNARAFSSFVCSPAEPELAEASRCATEVACAIGGCSPSAG